MGWCISVESEETAQKAVQVYNSRTKTHTARGGLNGYFPNAKKYRDLVIRVGTPLEHVVGQIIACKPKGEHITVLRIGSHGNAGGICISGEKNIPLAYVTADCLAPLKVHFKPPYGVIQIYACGVASDESIYQPGTRPEERKFRPGVWHGGIRPGDSLAQRLGYRLLARMAEVTGMPVLAPFDVQPQYATSLKGPQLWVYPDGNYVKL